MKWFFDHVDPITLGLGLLLAIIAGWNTWKKSGRNTRLAVLPFVFFAPVLIGTAMFMHLLEITYHAIDTKFTAQFSYSFYLYSLYLLGFLLFIIAVKYYNNTVSFCLSENGGRKKMFRSAGLIALICLPAVKIVFITAIPVIASFISLTASFFAQKKSVIKNDSEMLITQKQAVESTAFTDHSPREILK